MTDGALCLDRKCLFEAIPQNIYLITHTKLSFILTKLFILSKNSVTLKKILITHSKLSFILTQLFSLSKNAITLKKHLSEIKKLIKKFQKSI